MNRALIFGVALFLAVVGIALVTVDTNVEAGHRCKCRAKNDCCAPACCAPACCAPACCAPANCCPTACPPACHGAPVGPAVEPAPAPAAAARAQFGFRTVSFQR